MLRSIRSVYPIVAFIASFAARFLTRRSGKLLDILETKDSLYEIMVVSSIMYKIPNRA